MIWTESERQIYSAIAISLLVGIAYHFVGIIALALCFAFALPLVIRYAYVICSWFIFFSYFRLHEATPQLMPFKIPQLLAMGSLLGLSWQLWINRHELNWTRGHTLLVVFTLYAGMCCLLASNRALAMMQFTDIFIKIIIMVFAISWLPRSLDQLKRFPAYVIICGIWIASIAIYNQIHGIGLVEGTRVSIGRDIRSMLGDPNDLALVLQFPVAFALSYMFFGPKWRRALSAIGFIIIIIGILCTQSRGGLLAITGAICTVTVLRTKSLLLPGVLGAIDIGLLAIVAGISGRSSGGAAESGVDESAMGRLWAWQAAYRMAFDNPLTGVGLDNFYHNYYFYSSHWDGINHAVHSTWFQVLAEMGFGGLIVFITLVVTAIKMTKRLRERLEGTDMQPLAESLWIGLAAFCVGGTFLTQGFTWPIYILIGLILALDRLTSDTPQSPVRHPPIDEVKQKEII